MSWTDEEIDKLAQESAESPSFKYKDEYWTEFEAMLPKGGGKNFTWFFTAFLFVGLLSTSLILNETFRTNESQFANELINENTLAGDNGMNQISTDQLNSNVTDVESEKTIEKTEAIQEIKTTAQNAITNNINTKTIRSVKQKAVYSVPTTDRIETTVFDPSIISVALGTENDELTDENLSDDSMEDNDEFKNNGNHEDLNDLASTEGGVIELSENELDPVKRSEKNTIETETISTLPLLGLYESVVTELMPLTLHNERELPAKATFYVGGFGGISESLITPSKDITTSFGLGLGAQIQKGRFTFTTGLNGVWSNHKDLNLTRSAKVYGFGSNQYNYEFKYKQIYTLEAELTVGYKLGRHLVNIGVRPSVIVGTKVGISESIDDKSGIDRNEYGYVTGLNRFGIKPMIGYSFDVTNSLKLGVNVGVEMMPKIQEGFLEGTSNRYPIDGQIYLRHSIKFRR